MEALRSIYRRENNIGQKKKKTEREFGKLFDDQDNGLKASNLTINCSKCRLVCDDERTLVDHRLKCTMSNNCTKFPIPITNLSPVASCSFSTIVKQELEMDDEPVDIKPDVINFHSSTNDLFSSCKIKLDDEHRPSRSNSPITDISKLRINYSPVDLEKLRLKCLEMKQRYRLSAETKCPVPCMTYSEAEHDIFFNEYTKHGTTKVARYFSMTRDQMKNRIGKYKKRRNIEFNYLKKGGRTEEEKEAMIDFYMKNGRHATAEHYKISLKVFDYIKKKYKEDNSIVEKM